MFQHGVGLASAYDVVYNTVSGCVNVGKVGNNLVSTEHCRGQANQDGDGYTWDESYIWDEGITAINTWVLQE